MNWRKVFLFITFSVAMILAPLTVTFAEEEDNEVPPDDIIGREDQTETDIENIPDPPRDESLIGDEEDVHEVEIQTPSSVTGEKREGSGTVVDFSTTGARAFYTIVDNEDNTFYLMIDMDKPDNNVYFLSDVNQQELGSATGNEGNEINPIDNIKQENASEEEIQTEDQVASEGQELEEEDGSSSNWIFALTIFGIGAIGAVAYHFLIKNRRKKDDEDDDMDEIYEDEDMVYEEIDEQEAETAATDENSNESDNR